MDRCHYAAFHRHFNKVQYISGPLVTKCTPGPEFIQRPPGFKNIPGAECTQGLPLTTCTPGAEYIQRPPGFKVDGTLGQSVTKYTPGAEFIRSEYHFSLLDIMSLPTEFLIRQMELTGCNTSQCDTIYML